MMRYAALAILLTACATPIPGDPGKLSADQITALVKDKNATVGCVSAKNAAGNVTTVYANIDQAKALGGEVTINPDCSTTIKAGGAK